MWLVEFVSLLILASKLHGVTCVCPRIISRENWNASSAVSIKPLSQNPPPFIVVHHSDTRSCDTEATCKKLVKSIQTYHMNDLHWEDVGYNFLVGGDGRIYEGRGWGVHGAHVVKFNKRSLGICLLGNFQDEDPPFIQVEALRELLVCAVEQKKTIEDYHLIGHNQGTATLCPGKKLFSIIKKWQNFDENPQ